MSSYKNSGAIDCSTSFDTSNVRGKTAVVTGGANGLGEAYVRRLVKEGAYVVFGDLDEKCGTELASELKSAEFVKCDVTKWQDQLDMFKKALSSSPNKRVDIVIANAGISGPDSVFMNDPELEEPEEPKLNIVNVNAIGALYTAKLAVHYFRRQHTQNPDSKQDTVLILQGSLAGYLDLVGAPQYALSKFGLRGVMRSLRHSELKYGTRVNFIGPWFVKTKILSAAVIERLSGEGITYATVEDAADAVLRMASDQNINGRSFGIVPREWAAPGYIDLDVDDYKEGDFLLKPQQQAVKPAHRAEVPAKLQQTQ